MLLKIWIHKEFNNFQVRFENFSRKRFIVCNIIVCTLVSEHHLFLTHRLLSCSNHVERTWGHQWTWILCINNVFGLSSSYKLASNQSVGLKSATWWGFWVLIMRIKKKCAVCWLDMHHSKHSGSVKGPADSVLPVWLWDELNDLRFVYIPYWEHIVTIPFPD